MARIIFSDDETYGEISQKDFEEIAKLICRKNKFVNKVELRQIEELPNDIIQSTKICEYKEEKTYVDQRTSI